MRVNLLFLQKGRFSNVSTCDFHVNGQYVEVWSFHILSRTSWSGGKAMD